MIEALRAAGHDVAAPGEDDRPGSVDTRGDGVQRRKPAPRKPAPLARAPRFFIESLMARSIHLTAAVTKEDDLYVAQCLEVDVASQGDTVETALANLHEALELYFEDGHHEPRASLLIAPVELSVPSSQ